ncbi:L-lactate transporter [subsurface metagenome]
MDKKHPKVFYGWWIVSACFLITLYTGGIIFYGFTAIFEPIANEFGWSYTQISLAASLRGLEMSLLAPFIGILADRWGPKRLIFSGVVITAVGLILLSYAMSLAMFYGAFILIAIGIGGCSVTVLMIAVVNWFRRHVGIASGIVVSGFGFSGLLVPVIVTLIEMYGWRLTMTILALGMLAIVLPLSLLVRHKPEQYGYLPYGQVEGSVTLDNSLSPAQAVGVDVKVKQVLKNSTFWCIALAFTFHVMVSHAIITHVMPYLSSIGVARSSSSLVATAIPLTSIGGRLGLGWLGDKLDRRRVAAGALAMMGLGLLCFGYVSVGETWLLVPFLILFGIGYGGAISLRTSLVREFFGRSNFGTVFGLLIGINMLGGVIGPPVAGWVYDNWGSYEGIWLAFAGLVVIAVVLVAAIPRPRSSPARGQLEGTTSIG